MTEIHAHPGMAVATGEDLCDLSYHKKLAIRGQAFESDLSALTKITEDNQQIAAEFGHQHHGDHSHVELRRGLQLTHIDNHVDATTQTFAFYLALENEIVQQSRRDERLYQQWRFKPGQRVHLRIPIRRHSQTLKVPADALTMESESAFVYRQFIHEHTFQPGKVVDQHAHADLELEPVPVRVLYRNGRDAILDPNGELHPGDVIAMNVAYKLRLIQRLQASEGGGHDHGHDH